MRLIFVSLVAVFLLCVGLFGRARTVQAESDTRSSLSSIPTATERAAKALSLLRDGSFVP
jgi:hypothetical protein